MSLHDTIIGNCPKCGDFLKCVYNHPNATLAIYDIDRELSIEDVAKIDGWIIDCHVCGAEFMLDADFPIEKIKLRYVK